MPYTVEGALDDHDLTVVDRNDEMGEYVVRIGSLSTPVVISLRRLPRVEMIEFRTSHALKHPGQMGPYQPSRPFEDDYAHALSRAVTSLTDYYREGVEAGHLPEETWLVAN